VLLYHGSASAATFDTTVVQRIDASDMHDSSLTTFGWSLSGGRDMDGNGYEDVLVGAYASDRAVLLRLVMGTKGAFTGREEGVLLRGVIDVWGHLPGDEAMVFAGIHNTVTIYFHFRTRPIINVVADIDATRTPASIDKDAGCDESWAQSWYVCYLLHTHTHTHTHIYAVSQSRQQYVYRVARMTIVKAHYHLIVMCSRAH
jgi:hypothetical protein